MSLDAMIGPGYFSAPAPTYPAWAPEVRAAALALHLMNRSTRTDPAN
ncbi:MAG: hypothetical protein IPK16_09610 [Anaerolineales bacterium]|nr:hypothetical protein [Anaerolineales bacterium]